MNSQVTLTDYSVTSTSKGHVRLLFKRSDTRHAVLLEDNVPRFFIGTSSGFNQVAIRDAGQQMVVNIKKRLLLDDVFTFAHRNAGKTVPVVNVLKRTPTTSDGQISIMLQTDEGLYYWRQRRGNHWVLYKDESCTPQAWTETVPGSGPTWALVFEEEASNVVDYILGSLFYLKSSTSYSFTEVGKDWERVDHRAAYFSEK